MYGYMFKKELKGIENYFLNKSEYFSNVQSADIKACKEEGTYQSYLSVRIE